MTLRERWTYFIKPELRRKEEDFLFWLARRLPQRLKYYVFIVVGADAIEDHEVVPEVEYVTLLKRVPSGRN